MRCKILLLSTLLMLMTASLAAAGEIVVSAAASLTEALTEIKGTYEKAHPGTTVVTNFAASGTLLQQIAQGAPVDVFVSADQKSMDQAKEKGLIDTASRRDFVSNGLVLVVPADSKLGLTDAPDLEKKEVAKIGVGNPETVPVGRYTQESLAAAGLWDKLQPKAVFGNSVKQVLDYASRGEVDAAFVFTTDAKAASGKVKIVKEMAGHKPILYPLALVSTHPVKPEAKAFVDYLMSSEAQDLLGRFGFGRP